MAERKAKRNDSESSNNQERLEENASDTPNNEQPQAREPSGDSKFENNKSKLFESDTSKSSMRNSDSNKNNGEGILDEPVYNKRDASPSRSADNLQQVTLTTISLSKPDSVLSEKQQLFIGPLSAPPQQTCTVGRLLMKTPVDNFVSDTSTGAISKFHAVKKPADSDTKKSVVKECQTGDGQSSERRACIQYKDINTPVNRTVTDTSRGTVSKPQTVKKPADSETKERDVKDCHIDNGQSSERFACSFDTVSSYVPNQNIILSKVQSKIKIILNPNPGDVKETQVKRCPEAKSETVVSAKRETFLDITKSEESNIYTKEEIGLENGLSSFRTSFLDLQVSCVDRVSKDRDSESNDTESEYDEDEQQTHADDYAEHDDINGHPQILPCEGSLQETGLEGKNSNEVANHKGATTTPYTSFNAAVDGHSKATTAVRSHGSAIGDPVSDAEALHLTAVSPDVKTDSAAMASGPQPAANDGNRRCQNVVPVPPVEDAADRQQVAGAFLRPTLQLVSSQGVASFPLGYENCEAVCLSTRTVDAADQRDAPDLGPAVNLPAVFEIAGATNLLLRRSCNIPAVGRHRQPRTRERLYGGRHSRQADFPRENSLTTHDLFRIQYEDALMSGQGNNLVHNSRQICLLCNRRPVNSIISPCHCRLLCRPCVETIAQTGGSCPRCHCLVDNYRLTYSGYGH